MFHEFPNKWTHIHGKQYSSKWTAKTPCEHSSKCGTKWNVHHSAATDINAAAAGHTLTAYIQTLCKSVLIRYWGGYWGPVWPKLGTNQKSGWK